MYTRVHRLLRVITIVQGRKGLNAKALALAVLVEQVGGAEQIGCMRPAARALEKIRASLPAAVSAEVGAVVDAIVIRTAASDGEDGIEDVYERVRGALAAKRALGCRYESLEGTSPDEDFEFEPYVLFFSVRAWYTLGYHCGRGEVRCLKLSRFARLTRLEREYRVPEGFTVDGYLRNAWRMIPEGEDVEVELEFAPTAAATMGDTRWHKTQRMEYRDDGSAVMRCTVSGLGEIAWWVLSYGPMCRVIGPRALAERVAELAAQTAAQYAVSNGTTVAGSVQ